MNMIMNMITNVLMNIHIRHLKIQKYENSKNKNI